MASLMENRLYHSNIVVSLGICYSIFTGYVKSGNTTTLALPKALLQ